MPSTKREALAIGSKHYFTGKPCKHGHVAKRWTHNGVCEECCRQAGTKWYESHKSDLSRRKQQIVQRVVQRAKRTGIPVNISTNDIAWPTHCPVFGYELSYFESDKDRSVSLDRIDPSKGYVIGNVQVMSMRANRAKWNLTLSEVEQLYEYLRIGS